jgi:hypothetical protein
MWTEDPAGVHIVLVGSRRVIPSAVTRETTISAPRQLAGSRAPTLRCHGCPQAQGWETSTVTDIARHRAGRLRVMNAIYEAAEGSRMSHVSGGWLLEHLELSDEELGGICRYLEGKHLITAGREDWGHHTPFMILLTHAGIEEMKRSRAAPDQATEHFPPISVIHVEGDAIGSAIQPGSPRAHQAVSVSHLNLDNARQIVGEFEAQAASLPLPDGDARQLRADMAAVKVQLDLPTPDHHTIRGHLQSARAILEHATDRTAAAGLLDLLRNLQV